MTYRDKFRAEHPVRDADLIHVFLCPTDPKTGSVVDCIPPSEAGGCRACWDREIEEVHSENEIP